MTQLNSSSGEIKVIVLDVHGTIMGGGGEYPIIKREGLDDFFQRYGQRRFATYTDAGDKPNEEKLRKEYSDYFNVLKIGYLVEKMYFGWDMEDFGQKVKNLEEVADDFNVKLNELVIIGDGYTDRLSAERYSVRLIYVPSIDGEIRKFNPNTNKHTYVKDYQSIPNKFSFATLNI